MPNSSSVYGSVRSNLLGTSMLSFELSAIDLILVIAVVILLILYITKLSTKSTAEQKPNVDKRGSSEKPAAKAARFRAEGEIRSPTHSPKDSAKCHHHFGYLKKLGKNAAIPDECLSCLKIMECFGPSE